MRDNVQPKAAERDFGVDAQCAAGAGDRYLDGALVEPHRDNVPNLEQVVRLPRASHWVQHDEPERVSELLVEFFGAG